MIVFMFKTKGSMGDSLFVSGDGAQPAGLATNAVGSPSRIGSPGPAAAGASLAATTPTSQQVNSAVTAGANGNEGFPTPSKFAGGKIEKDVSCVTHILSYFLKSVFIFAESLL